MELKERIADFLNEGRKSIFDGHTPAEYASKLKGKYNGDMKKANAYAKSKVRTAKNSVQSNFYHDVLVLLGRM